MATTTPGRAGQGLGLPPPPIVTGGAGTPVAGQAPGGTGAPGAGQQAPGTGQQAPTVVAPRFGGVEHGVAWVGGKPKADYTGVENTHPEGFRCYRDPNPLKEAKAAEKRVEGLATKYDPEKKSCQFPTFQDDVKERLEQCGIDTPFYIRHPVVADRVLDIIENHGQVTVEKVIESIEKMKADGEIDVYLERAMKDSAEFILNSLTPSFKKTVTSQMTAEMRKRGPCVWQTVVEEAVPRTLPRLKSLKEAFEALKLSTIPGENVNTWSDKVGDLLDDLRGNKALPEGYLSTMISHLTTCSVEAFRSYFYSYGQQVRKFESKTARMDEELIARNVAAEDRYDHHKVIKEARHQYRDMADDWGPSKIAKNDIEAKMGALIQDHKKMKNRVQQLESKESEPKERKGNPKCYNCGEYGHIAPNCSKPDRRTQKEKEQPKDADEEKKKALRTPPKEGESLTKKMYGETLNWCAKCRRWNKTHTTPNHKKKSELNAQPQANVADVSDSVSSNLLLSLGQWNNQA